MNRDELLKIRAEIANSARQIALEGDVEPADKLEILMSLIASGDSSAEVLHRVYDTAKLLPDDTDRLSALLDIMYEVDKMLSSQPGDDSEAHLSESESRVNEDRSN